MEKIGAAWEKQKKNGETFYSISLNGRLVMFKNGYKTKDNHPDYILYIDSPPKREQADNDETPFGE